MQFGLVGNVVGCINEVNQHQALLVLGWLTVCKPSRYVASHPGQLSLAIPSWVGAMSTSESWNINRHTARCTSLISELWFGWGWTDNRILISMGRTVNRTYPNSMLLLLYSIT